MKQLIHPANNALNEIDASSDLRSGAIPPKTPSWIPIDEKFENPANA